MMATCRDCKYYDRLNRHYCNYYNGEISENILDMNDAKQNCAGYEERGD